MSTATIQARPVLPTLKVRRGLLEPYDLLLLSAWLVAAIIGYVSGYTLLSPQVWMLPNILESFGFFVGCFALLFVARLVNLRVRHHRLPALTFRVALARHFGWSTVLHALRFAVAFELIRLPATTLVQRLPWFRALPHRPHLPQVWDGQIWSIEQFVHLGFDLPAILASLAWPAWAGTALDYIAMFWLVLPGAVVAYALSCSHRLRADRLFVALLGVWLACPLVALVVPTTGPFLMQQEVFPASGMTMTAELQQAKFYHWNMHLFPTRDGAMIEGFGLMGFPSLPAAVLTVCVFFCRKTCREVRLTAVVLSVVVLVGMLAAGWHHALSIYAGILLAAGVWWSAGVLMRRTTRHRAFRPDDVMR